MMEITLTTSSTTTIPSLRTVDEAILSMNPFLCSSFSYENSPISKLFQLEPLIGETIQYEISKLFRRPNLSWKCVGCAVFKMILIFLLDKESWSVLSN